VYTFRAIFSQFKFFVRFGALQWRVQKMVVKGGERSAKAWESVCFWPIFVRFGALQWRVQKMVVKGGERSAKAWESVRFWPIFVHL